MIFETELQGFTGRYSLLKFVYSYRIVRYCILRKNEVTIDSNAINNDKTVPFVAIDGDMVSTC